THKPKVVILGTGWASIAALNKLDRDKYESITVISPRNSFLFTPLLPCTAVGTLSHTSVAIPIRDITSYKRYLPPTIEYAYAYASEIDPLTKQIKCNHSGQFSNHSSEFTIGYDKLIMSVGCKTNTWNTPGVEEHCHYLKESGDAILMRQQIIENLELASLPNMTDADKNRLLSFYIVGGGPTGVELAAELSDLLHEDIANQQHSFFRGVKADMSNVSVTLVQSAPKLLPGFPHQIQDFCQSHLNKESKVDVMLNTRVTGVSDTTMELYDKHTKTTRNVPYGLVVWTAGVQPTDIAHSLLKEINSVTTLNDTTIQTDSHCRVLGAPDIFAVGDCADIVLLPEYMKYVTDLFQNKLTLQQAIDPPPPPLPPVLSRSSPTQRLVKRILADLEKLVVENNIQLDFETVEKIVEERCSRQKHLPPTAQVAQQQGHYVADLLNNSVIDMYHNDESTSFQYLNRGQLVYVGAHVASMALPGTNDIDVTWAGTATNFVWHAAYFGMLESTTGRYELAVDWIKSYVFGR
ncbi:FAD/NAD(P)-binding domain-containing protein, partial [Fragilariopsis cylindrus CCMP1102]